MFPPPALGCMGDVGPVPSILQPWPGASTQRSDSHSSSGGSVDILVSTVWLMAVWPNLPAHRASTCLSPMSSESPGLL